MEGFHPGWQGSRCTIDIRLGAATAEGLRRGGFRLYAYKAVMCDQGGGSPTVWASVSRFGRTVGLNWREDYRVFATERPITAESCFLQEATRPVELGEVLTAGPGGRLEDTADTDLLGEGGEPGRVVLRNATRRPLTCGLAQPSPTGRGPVPVCALPLHGRNVDVITPLQEVALTFSTTPARVGSVPGRVRGPVVLVDLTRGRLAELRYDLDGGWSWDGDAASWLPAGSFTDALVRGSDPAGTCDDPVTGLTLWTAAPHDPWAPDGLVASGAGGTEGHRRITSAAPPGPGGLRPAEGGLYLATYLDCCHRPRMWQVRCVRPPASGVAYALEKLREAPPEVLL
jgi:hypothetical protein